MSPILANKLQPVRVGVLSPQGVYSRVVSCVAYIKSPMTTGFAYTASLGNRLWLLRVKVWFDPRVWSELERMSFRICHGTSVPINYAAILEWKNLLPALQGGNENWDFTRWQYLDPLEFEMNQLFEGKGLRFGILVSVNPTLVRLHGYASFQISEG